MPTPRRPRRKRLTMKGKAKKRKYQKVPANDEDEEKWEVEYIVKARVKSKRGVQRYWEYYVKWLGWAHDFDSWEPDASFADADILEDFWSEIDECYNTPNEVLVNKDVMFAGREVFPSEEWIETWKRQAVAATDMPLPQLPDPRAVTPFHEEERQPPAPVTAAGSMWQQGAPHLDDDPDSQSSESEDISDDGSDNELYNTGSDAEELPGTRRRRYAQIPENPRHYYRRDRPQPQDVQLEDLDTPQGLHKRTNDSRMQPSTTIFLNSTRDAGILRANKRRKLESHRRGPVSRRPQPIRLFTREELQRIEATQYDLFAALQHGGTGSAEEDQDSDSEEEAQAGPSFFTGDDGEQPAASSPVLSEGEIPEEGEGRAHQPLFYADDDDEDDMYVDEPPASSPIPASPSPPGTPTAPRRFTVLGPAGEENIAAMDEDTATPTAAVDIEELINTDFLGGANLSTMAWGPGRLQSEDSTLSSTATATGQNREGGDKAMVVVVDEPVDSEMEDGEIRE